MDELTDNEDGWVVARIAALERGNRRLWIALGALTMTLVSVCIAAGLLATTLELPGPMTGAPRGTESGRSLVADDVTVRGALRVVDEAGRSLVFIGRESVEPGSAGANQAVIGLFAGTGSDAPQQTIRIATSPAGSALSLGTPDGTSSVSIFAGESAVSVDLRKGDTTHTLSERAESPPPPPPQAVVSEGPRVETPPTATIRPTGDATRGAVVDLSDPAVQPIGDGFSVVGLTLSDESGVLRVRGRLVNSTSVDQLRAEFSLLVAGRELPFSVARIPPGGSTPFTLELPPVKSDALRSARFRWVRSTVSYPEE
jgi:hypothetical protein